MRTARVRVPYPARVIESKEAVEKFDLDGQHMDPHLATAADVHFHWVDLHTWKRMHSCAQRRTAIHSAAQPTTTYCRATAYRATTSQCSLQLAEAYCYQ